MTAEAVESLPAPERRRLIALGLGRAIIATVALVAVYYVLPLDHLSGVPLWVFLTVGLIVLVMMSAYQVRAVMRAPNPGVRAIEGLATTAPLFILLFAATYYVMARSAGYNFSVHQLTRTDSLYFTVTVFATVGFGDITATSQSARVLVTVQMVLDLIVLGLGVRVFIGAVQIARKPRSEPEQTPS